MNEMSRNDLASLIFALKTYDPSKPLYVSQQVKQAYDAVDAFNKYSKEHRLRDTRELVSKAEKLLLEISGTNKIKAIKEFRTLTGMGLKESKDAIDYLVAHGKLPDQIAEWLHEQEMEQYASRITGMEAQRRPLLMMTAEPMVGFVGASGPAPALDPNTPFAISVEFAEHK